MKIVSLFLIVCLSPSLLVAQEASVIRCDPHSQVRNVPIYKDAKAFWTVGTLPCDQTVSLLMVEQGYAKIRYGEHTGYVDAKFTRPLKTESTVLPAVAESRESQHLIPPRNQSVPSVEPTVQVFVGEMTGPDSFISERFRMLFFEKLSALKSIELVDSKETAEYIIEGIGRVENLVDIQENGKTTAMAGENSNALLSVKLIYATSKKILLVVNENAKSDKRPTSMSVPDLVARHFWGKEATEAVVEKTVDQICKKMKWK